MSPLHLSTVRIAGKGPTSPFIRIVKTSQEKPEHVDPNNLIHSKCTNIENNDQNNTKKLIEPDKVENDALDTDPAASTDNEKLTANLPVPQNVTESKPATDSHVDPKISNSILHEVSGIKT